jgi:hypothetical protein
LGPRLRGDRGVGIEVVVIDFVSYFERENLGPRRRGQVNLDPRLRGDRGVGIEVVVIDFVSYFERENLGPRRRGDRVRLTTTKPILPRSRVGGSLIF